ncbi:MAG: TIR domain-containing protein [Candidatus Binatia bacterium]
MAEIFISYSSEDVERAQVLAGALGTRGWSVWWDRKIPLGMSYDQVIEKALTEAKCAIVLWSAVSVGSEWVRSEASEAKRRGILIPVFIEHVDAPLAFRLMNGADLSAWQPGNTNAEFDQLTERIAELLGQPREAQSAVAPGTLAYSSSRPRRKPAGDWFRSPFALIVLALVIAAAFGGYFIAGGITPNNKKDIVLRPDEDVKTKTAIESRDDTDLEKRIKDFAGVFGGAVPATSLAKGFHVPDLGLRVAFISPDQSASTLGSLPTGAVIMEVESGRPAAHAGLQVGDVVTTIAGKSIDSEDDLRRAIFKIGPGKTTYSYHRGNEAKTVAIDCRTCKAE